MDEKQVEKVLVFIKNDPIKVWDFYQRVNENLKHLILKLSRQQYFKWCDKVNNTHLSHEEEKNRVFSIFCLYMEFTKTESEIFKTLGIAAYVKEHEN